jgi:hypothetical protein
LPGRLHLLERRTGHAIRVLKKHIRALLEAEAFEKSLTEILKFPARRVINPLLSFFYQTDPNLRWRAIMAAGAVVSRLAESDLESARVIMRRLLWNVNDESGGIGWGSPEAMAEIMAKSPRLAQEYASILISFIDQNQNYIELEALQKGVLWGIGRISQTDPQWVQAAAPYLIPFLKSPDPEIRGLATWAAAGLDEPMLKPWLNRLADDHIRIKIFIDQKWLEIPISQLAETEYPKGS